MANILVDGKHPLRVFIQIENDLDSAGVSVRNKTATGFDVVERQGGRSTFPFQWHIVANRADELFENGVLSKNADTRFDVVIPFVTHQVKAP